MNELIQKNDDRITIRWKLLTGASALALLASSPSMGESADHPLLWVEFGGSADMLTGFGDRFSAPFLEQTPTPTPFLNGSPIDLQKPPRFTFGGEGKITFQPDDSDWVLSAGIKFGRSNNKRDVHHQSVKQGKFENFRYDIYKLFYYNTPTKWSQLPDYAYVSANKFAETTVNQGERHLILDFQAGRDVGLGMFGRDSTSVLSAGVRVARFNSHSDVQIRAKPDLEFYTVPFFYSLLHVPVTRWSTYYLHGHAERSFNGIGPTLSWSASAPLAGDVQEGELSLDWGVNGAVLFGRQKSKTSHHTTQRDLKAKYYTTFQTSVFHNAHTTHYFTRYQNRPPAQNRSRNVTVPNLGANIGISYRIDDAKLSLGYRADYFFGAMDGGIDAAKKTTLVFNGLYASISIGLGD